MRCKLLMAPSLAATVTVAGQVATAPPAAAAAINVSDAAQHRIRKAVNRYAEIQVAQREPYCYGGTGPTASTAPAWSSPPTATPA